MSESADSTTSLQQPPCTASHTVRDRWMRRFGAVEEAALRWKAVGLSALQKTSLEGDALQMATNRELVVVGRKTVGQKTRDFAKLSTDEKAAEMGPTLKCYQAYIDELTRCLKFAEHAYLDLNSLVQGMPDPYLALSRLAFEKNAILDLVKSAEDLEVARQTVAERETELSELRNQEVTIQALREELAAAEMRAVQGAQVAQSAADATSELDHVLKQWQAREAAMQQELAALAHEGRTYRLQAQRSGEQQATLRARLDEVEVLRDKETDAHFHELEGLQVALSAAEHGADLLRAEKQRTADSSGGGGIDDAAAHCVDTAALDALKSDATQWRTRCDDANAVAVAAGQRADQATAALKAAMEELQRLRPVQQYFNDALRSQETCQAELLGARNEVAQLRQRVGEAETSEAALRTEAATLEKEVRRLMRVEEKMERQNRGQIDSAGDASGGAGPLAAPFDLALVVGAAPRLPQNADAAATHPPKDAANEAAEGLTQKGEEDAFLAVAMQRDRYRKRLLALEETSEKEVEALKAQLQKAQVEVTQLQQCLRGTFAGTQQGHGAATSSLGFFSIRMPPSSAAAGGGGGGLVGESSVGDRLAMFVARLLMANNYTRRVFFAYLFALHVLVVLLLVGSLV